MRRHLAGRLTTYVLSLVLVVIVGCSRTQTTRFYTLNALANPGTDGPPASSGEGIAVGLGPIRLPAYLDRPQIVTRAKPNEVRFAEFHRWAGPLDADVSRILAENLSILLGTDRIALYPWKHTTPIDLRVEIHISRMDGKTGGDVVLQSQWILFSGDRNRIWATRTSTLREPAGGKGYEALVAAQSRALAALSREIAEAIIGLPQRRAEE